MAKKKSKPFPLREEIEKAIEEITSALKKPGIPFNERLMLHEDRKDLRRALANTNS